MALFVAAHDCCRRRGIYANPSLPSPANKDVARELHSGIGWPRRSRDVRRWHVPAEGIPSTNLAIVATGPAQQCASSAITCPFQFAQPILHRCFVGGRSEAKHMQPRSFRCNAQSLGFAFLAPSSLCGVSKRLERILQDQPIALSYKGTRQGVRTPRGANRLADPVLRRGFDRIVYEPGHSIAHGKGSRRKQFVLSVYHRGFRIYTWLDCREMRPSVVEKSLRFCPSSSRHVGAKASGCTLSRQILIASRWLAYVFIW
jgi:hypothetical protein